MSCDELDRIDAALAEANGWPPMPEARKAKLREVIAAAPPMTPSRAARIARLVRATPLGDLLGPPG